MCIQYQRNVIFISVTCSCFCWFTCTFWNFAVRYHNLFLFFFILNTNKQAILARTEEEKIKVQIEVADEKLTGAILRQKSLVRGKMFNVFFNVFNVLMPRVKKYSHYMPAGSKANLGGSCIYYKE